MSWDETGQLEELRKLELRRRAGNELKKFFNLSKFRSWVPRIATTDFWLAISCAIPHEIENT